MTADGPLDAVESEFVAVVALREQRSATGDVRLFLREIAVRVLDAVVIGLRERLARRRRAGRRWPAERALHDEVRDRLGIAQAVRMMGGAFLDHHGDPAAQLLIDVLDGQRMLPRMGSRLPQTCSRGTSFLASSPSFMRAVPADRRDCRRRCRKPCRGWRWPRCMRCTPPRLMPMKAGFLDSPCFSVRNAYQASHGLPGSDVDEGDVKTPLEQFDLGLGLVVPVTASPGPRVAGRRLLRNDHDAPPLALHLALDPILFVRRRLDRLDGQGLLVHQEVVAVEPVPGGLLAREGRRRVRRDGVL